MSMAIEGLMVPQSGPIVETLRTGSVDVAEAVGVTMEAYTLLGYVGDPENAERHLTQAFETNAGLGLAGRLFVPAPKAITFSSLVDAAEGKRSQGVEKRQVYPNLWTPGTESESYTEEELNKGPEKAVARLALFNDDPSRDGEIDPVLHYTGLPYDDYAKERWGGETTQLDELKKYKIAFEKDHPEFGLEVADHRDFAMLALMDRIRGIKGDVDPKTANFILNRGFMRIKNLGRRTVGGDSVVGDVSSDDGRLDFYGSGGSADSGAGLGVVVGPKELKA